MDILTPRGQETREQERAAIELFRALNPSFSFIETPKDKPVHIDGFIVQQNVILAAVETKCRTCTVETFRGQFNNEWLLTRAKFDTAAFHAALLYVPLVGFLYLVPSKVLLVKKLWHPVTGFSTGIRNEETRTQATVNGGTAVRLNAFIDMTDAKIYAAP